MNLDMAQCARLELGILVVKRRRSWCCAESRRSVALQAKHVNVTEFQHVRIRRTVRQVAGRAPFHFHGGVFVNERTVLIHMAFVANGILSGSHAYLLGLDRAMYVMAISALNQAFVDTMMKRHGKLRFLL
jgi:hypothetical protein